MGRRIAFLIGNQTFREDSGLPSLRGPLNDVEAMNRVLRDRDLGRFEATQFCDKQHYEILPLIEEELNSAAMDDLFLLFYAGHGLLDASGSLHLATANTRAAALQSTSIPSWSLHKLVANSSCNAVILLLDCCYSGAVSQNLRGTVTDQLQALKNASGFFILTASTAIQSAGEAESERSGLMMGRFTAAIVDGIETGIADHDYDGRILLSDIKRHAEGILRGQTPQFFAHATVGDPLISLNPKTIFGLLHSPNLDVDLADRRQQANVLAAQYSNQNTDPIRYLREAATLRLNLYLNEEDEEFAQIGGRIYYMMDANIVAFFLHPDKEIAYATAFGERGNDSASSTAIITAEYLFSGHLPGQMGNSALIAPGHAEEVAELFATMQRQSAILAKSGPEPLDPELQIKVRSLVENARRGNSNRTAALDELRRLVPAVAAMILDGPWQGAHQLQRLFAEDRLRPLAAHRPALPDPQDVADWIHRISARRAPSNLVERQRVVRDAEVLAQLLLLNASAPKSTRYLLITSDDALASAYVEWFWKDPTQRYLLRSPLQYTPILNVREMPNAHDPGTLFFSCRTALNTRDVFNVIATFVKTDVDFVEAILENQIQTLQRIEEMHLLLSLRSRNDLTSDLRHHAGLA